MKLINSQQRAKIRLRFEILASATLATILVSTFVLLSTPGYLSAARQLIV